jgi:hypothetical protein
VDVDVDVMPIPVRAYSHVGSVNLFLKIQNLQNEHFHSTCILGGWSFSLNTGTNGDRGLCGRAG